jgi:hypothetical protein
MRNAVTPVEVRSLAGKPTVRKAQSLGGNLMTEWSKGNGKPGREWLALRLAVLDNRPDTGRGARTRKGADAVR